MGEAGGSIEQEIDDRAEVYTVRDEVWARARHAVDGRLPVRRSSGEASRPQTEAEALIPGPPRGCGSGRSSTLYIDGENPRRAAQHRRA